MTKKITSKISLAVKILEKINHNIKIKFSHIMNHAHQILSGKATKVFHVLGSFVQYFWGCNTFTVF